MRHVRQREFSPPFCVCDERRIIPVEGMFVEIPQREIRPCRALASWIGRIHDHVTIHRFGEVPAVAKRVCHLQLDLGEELLVLGVGAQEAESPQGLAIQPLLLHHTICSHPPPVLAGVIVARLLRPLVCIFGLPVHRHFPVHLGGHQGRRRPLFRGGPELCGLVKILPRRRVVLVLLRHLSEDERGTGNHLRLVVLPGKINDGLCGLPGLLAGVHPVLGVGEQEPCLDGAGAIGISTDDLVEFPLGLLILVLVIVGLTDHHERIIDEL